MFFGARCALLSAVFMSVALPSYSQQSGSERVLIDVEMTQGTNLAAALSPDGSTLVLALQGVLWTLPASGGVATPITAPEMDAHEPAWSPDGGMISFYAFAEDGFTIWTVAPDGGDLREVTQPYADARYPAFSPDNNRLFYSSDEQQGYSVWSVDVRTMERSQLTDASETGYTIPTGPYFSGVGNAVYPTLSPDGETLAFVIDGQVNSLVLRDMRAGSSYQEIYSAPVLGAPLWAPDGSELYVVGMDATEGYLARVPVDGSPATRLVEGRDVFPFRPSLSPDGYLIYTADGGIHSVTPLGVAGPSIEFSAAVTLDRTPYQRRTYALADQTPKKPLGIIDPVLSPDGSQAVYAALGDLWLADIETGEVEQLTDDVFIDLSPSWSPDGEQIAFITDRDGKADIWLMQMDSRQASRLTESERPANSPVWSPNGEKIAYLADFGNSVFVSATVNVYDIQSGQDIEISQPVFGPSAPAWSPDGERVAVYYRLPQNSRFREGLNAIYLLPADGQGEGIFVSPVPGKSLGRRQFNRPAWSVTGDMVYRIDGELWQVPLNSQGELGAAIQIADQGENPSWSADGSRLIYLDGADIKLFDKTSSETRLLDIKPDWVQQMPQQRMTVRAGKLFDGTGDSVRENVDIVFENGVITSVAAASASQPDGDFIDASDLFVTPGLIEGHTHQSISQGIGLGNLYLCHAITSVRETGDDPYHAVERREAAAVGRRPGPRVFTAGPLNEGARVSYGVSETVGTTERAVDADRLSTALQLDMYKSYVRQDYTIQKQAIELAHASGIPVSSHELYPAVAYGIDQMEHISATSRRGYSLKASRLNRSYQDVVALISQSGLVLIPTLALGDRPDRDNSGLRNTLVQIVNAGGRIMAGTDSPFVGHATSLHRELEIYVEAGLTAAQALRAATSDAATAIGAGDQLGRVAPGYLADIAMFSGDPFGNMSDIRNVHTVIKNGVVACAP